MKKELIKFVIDHLKNFRAYPLEAKGKAKKDTSGFVME